MPEPTPRKLIDETSPRASLTPPLPVAPPKLTSPICGIDRSSSSPVIAAVFSISCSLNAVIGNDPTSAARLIFEPVTEIRSIVFSLSVSAALTSCDDNAANTQMLRCFNLNFGVIVVFIYLTVIAASVVIFIIIDTIFLPYFYSLSMIN